MKRFLAGIAMLAAVGSWGTANAGAQVITSLPGASTTGQYDGADVVVTAGNVVYVNADPVAQHNVWSDAKKVPSCTVACEPLFKSGAPVSAGGVQQFSVAHLTPGDYPFHCSAHLNMKGTLKVVQ